MDDKVKSFLKFIVRNILVLILLYIVSTTLLFLLFLGIKYNITVNLFSLFSYIFTGILFSIYLIYREGIKPKTKRKKKPVQGKHQKLSEEEPVRWS